MKISNEKLQKQKKEQRLQPRRRHQLSKEKLQKLSKRYFVYIVECNDTSLYTGYTTDIKKRILAHNNGKAGAKYTKARRPVALKYFEECKTLSAALQREYALKKLSRKEKLLLLKA